MYKLFIPLACRAALVGMLCVPLFGGARSEVPASLPEFTHHQLADWINSKPLTVAALHGKVVLVEFWAFACVNCLHSSAWVESIADQDAAQGLVVVGVHTPELREEKEERNVRSAVRKLGITYPVMLDADYSYWNALKNQYWPAFYVIDRDGRVRATAIGEMHAGESNAQQLELAIKQLLDAHS
jgi:thiol-disulfide isomerase/thioredoxin